MLCGSSICILLYHTSAVKVDVPYRRINVCPGHLAGNQCHFVVLGDGTYLCDSYLRERNVTSRVEETPPENGVDVSGPYVPWTIIVGIHIL